MGLAKEAIDLLEQTAAAGMAGCRMCSGIRKGLDLLSGLGVVPLTQDEIEEITTIVEGKQNVPGAKARDEALIALMNALNNDGHLDLGGPPAAPAPVVQPDPVLAQKIEKLTQALRDADDRADAAEQHAAEQSKEIDAMKQQIADLEAKLAAQPVAPVQPPALKVEEKQPEATEPAAKTDPAPAPTAPPVK